MRRLLAFCLIVLAGGLSVVRGQAEPNLRLIVDRDQALTIYIAAGQPVDLDGLALGFLDSSGTVQNVQVTAGFDALRLSGGLAAPGACFIYWQTGTSPVLPGVCAQPAPIFKREITQADVFWFDFTANRRRDIAVLSNGSFTGICPASAVECPVLYMPPTPTAPTPPADTPTPPTDTPVPPSDTPAPTYTPVPPTKTPTPTPPYNLTALAALASSQTAYNADWTPFTKVFDGVEMALVPAGCFEMGITREGGRQCFYAPFWIDVTEVTNAEYRRCVEAGRCQAPTSRIYYDDPAFAHAPAVYVSWLEADVYARWRGCYLPSEREWEYAARGPDNLLYPWGGAFDGTLLNYCDANCPSPRADSTASDGHAYLAAVGSYPGGASWVGALDMSGNVAEWTGSLQANYPYLADAVEDGGADRRSSRIFRGGAWDDDRGTVRATYRAWGDPIVSSSSIGFRCARDFQPGDLTP